MGFHLALTIFFWIGTVVPTVYIYIDFESIILNYLLWVQDPAVR